MRKSIDEFTDAELAKMVRDSIYVKGVAFGEGENDSRFLLVLAVPYGKVDSVESLPSALDGFAELMRDDWEERTFQVYDHALGRFLSVSREDVDELCDCGESLEDGEGYDGKCGNCADKADETMAGGADKIDDATTVDPERKP